ncbi:hypothetical protein Tco_0953396 [Tanacetum coccineum]|uniref:Uncharacterized protein n=1 Tax=Tanacetum coccineum TaxID=301880 RepID=A0ABQ5DZT4_9ASTR
MYGMILYLVQCESLSRIPVFPPLTGCNRLVITAKVGHVDWLALTALSGYVRADGAQSSRVPVPLPNNPYVAVKQTHLVDTDIESDLEEDPSEVEELQSVGSRVPLMGEVFEAFEPIDHPTYHVSPTPTPTQVSFHSFHRKTARMTVHTQPTLSPGMSVRIAEAAALSPSSFRKRYRSSYETSSSSLTLPGLKRYRGTSELILDTDSERDELAEEDTKEDESDESQGLEGEGLGLEEEEEAALEARRRALESIEEIAPSTYEVGQSSRSVPELEGVERISAFRQPTLVTWVDPEDNRVYANVPAYAPPVAPVQAPPSPEWSLSSLPVSPSFPVVPSPIVSPVATPTDTISVDEDQFIARYRFRSLEREQERTAVMFGALWRPVLALEAWTGHAAMQHELQEMRGRVAALKQERGRREP